jgi:predicted DNA-binding antitoxin AbrB/MazE fold protein
MNKIHLLLAISLLLVTHAGAQTINQALPTFDKIQTGPLVKVVLQEGESEHIRIEYSGVSAEEINYSVKGKTLRIYLDDAKYTVKNRKEEGNGYTRKVPVYKGVKLTAYVTYKSLKAIELRGEEGLSCEGALISKKFRIRQYGASRIELAYLETNHLRVSSFGENTLKIRAGDAIEQQYRLFGENKIFTENMYGDRIRASSFGESSLRLFASQQIGLRGAGSIRMLYGGDAYLNKFVIGESSISKR